MHTHTYTCMHTESHARTHACTHRIPGGGLDGSADKLVDPSPLAEVDAGHRSSHPGLGGPPCGGDVQVLCLLTRRENSPKRELTDPETSRRISDRHCRGGAWASVSDVGSLAALAPPPGFPTRPSQAQGVSELGALTRAPCVSGGVARGPEAGCHGHEALFFSWPRPKCTELGGPTACRPRLCVEDSALGFWPLNSPHCSLW